MSSAWRTIATIATVGAIAAGGVAWYSKTQGQKLVDEERASTDRCKKELTACSSDRDEKEKIANAASASLSASKLELDELRAEHAESEKRLAAFKALTEKFQKMIDSGKLSIVLRHGRMVVKLPAGVLFASGSAELSKEGKDALREVAVILRTVHDRRFMVAGHTDNLPIDPRAVPPSPFKNNLELSTARALAVTQHLIASGMNPTRLVAAGYAEHEPVRENSTEAGRQENRRIEIVLMPNVTELVGIDAGTTSSSPPDAGTPKHDAGSAHDAAK